jgi:SAM-dependent methyltransferase
VHPASLRRLLETTPEDAVVLDVGGWGKPLTRADWVLDVMPWSTRGLYGRDGELPERFSEATWVARDICDREPWPFADKQFDVAVCSHVLEDIRDPIWVCSELSRVARSGYVETPSRLEEQSLGVHGPWAGWSHHRWFVELERDVLAFAHKSHVVHSRASDHFPPDFHATLTEEDRVVRHWWTDRLEARERLFHSGDDLDPWLADFVSDALRRRGWDGGSTQAEGSAGMATRLGRRVRRALLRRA